MISSELENFDWDNLGFSLMPVDYMYTMKCSEGEKFTRGQLSRYGNIELSPSACVLNYGQASLLCFELDMVIVVLFLRLYRCKTSYCSTILKRFSDNFTILASKTIRDCLKAPKPSGVRMGAFVCSVLTRMQFGCKLVQKECACPRLPLSNLCKL